MIKNTAGQKVGAQMLTASDGSNFTSAVTVLVTIDAGTQTTGSVGGGACTHEGNGYHTYAPSQAETNGDLIAFTFTGTGAVTQTVQVYTRAAVPTVDVNDKTGFAIGVGGISATSFAVGAIDAAALSADAGAELADAVHDEVVDGSVTFRQSVRLQNTAAGGKLSGAATSTVTIRDLGDTKNRVTATVDADGNRTAVTTDLS